MRYQPVCVNEKILPVNTIAVSAAVAVTFSVTFFETLFVSVAFTVSFFIALFVIGLFGAVCDAGSVTLALAVAGGL